MFNFSVFRLNKSVSRASPQNVMFTALPWQRGDHAVQNRIFIELSTIEWVAVLMRVNLEVPKFILLNFVYSTFT